VSRARALAFDFNGTLSDDEDVLCEIWQEILGELGRPLSAQEYYDRLVGLADPEIAAAWLGPDHPRAGWAMEERGRRYRERVADGSTVAAEAREAVRLAAARVPVGIVSGAPRRDIEDVVAATQLPVSVIVGAEDVARGKPDPEGYRRALRLLGDDLAPADVVVFEDSEVGIDAARAAGMRCIAVRGTVAPDRLAKAEEIVDALTAELVRRLL
jgi:beta-phosphoglucomutase